MQKTAIKKMDVQASVEFLCELKVLTHVHHLNLVHPSNNLMDMCILEGLVIIFMYSLKNH